MIYLINIHKKAISVLIGLVLAFFTYSCGIYKPVDARKISPNADERVKKNLEEGKGFTIMGGLGGNTKTNYQFASSNPMWRATLEILDFLPRADGLKVIVHKKKCTIQQNCTVKKVQSALESELQVAILRKAAVYEKEWISKNRKSRPDLKN